MHRDNGMARKRECRETARVQRDGESAERQRE